MIIKRKKIRVTGKPAPMVRDTGAAQPKLDMDDIVDGLGVDPSRSGRVKYQIGLGGIGSIITPVDKAEMNEICVNCSFNSATGELIRTIIRANGEIVSTDRLVAPSVLLGLLRMMAKMIKAEFDVADAKKKLAKKPKERRRK